MPEGPSSNWDGGCPLQLTLHVRVSDGEVEVETETTDVLSAAQARELAQQLLRFADHATSIPFDSTGRTRSPALAAVKGGSR